MLVAKLFVSSPERAIVVKRRGGGGGGARAARPLGVRRAPAGGRPAAQEDAARDAPPLAAVLVPTGEISSQFS